MKSKIHKKLQQLCSSIHSSLMKTLRSMRHTYRQFIMRCSISHPNLSINTSTSAADISRHSVIGPGCCEVLQFFLLNMASKYTCYVPKEWSVHPKQFPANTIKDRAMRQWKHCRNLEGATVRLENVTAKLNYNRFSPWKRKADDRNQSPHGSEYYGISMECILCSLLGSVSFLLPPLLRLSSRLI